MRALLDCSPQTGRSIVAVSGGPGIGKTRLLREFGSIARDGGRHVCWGQATEFERHVPFGVFTSALDDVLPLVEGDRLATLGIEWVSLLRTAFPALVFGASAPPPSDLIDAERFRLFRAVRALLDLVTEPSGLLVVLDDMHWADDGSLELCEYLLRHPPRSRLVLALAYRARQVPPRFAVALETAISRGMAEPLRLPPLSFDEASQLMDAGLGPTARRRLFDASGGNPFNLEALARTANVSTVLDRVTLPGDEPTWVQAALEAELGSLTATEMSVVWAAAVTGDAFEPDVVSEVAEVGVDLVLEAVDDLVRRDLVQPTDTGGRFRFRHPLVRSAAYRSAGAGWRLAAHRRAAVALQARGAPATMRAHHVELAASRGDQQAIAVLVDAANASMNAAPATAAHWLGAAVELLPDGPEFAAMRLWLLGMRARTLGVIGQLDESRTILHEVLRLLPAEMAEQRAQTIGFTAMIERLLGQHAEARALLVSELDRVDPAGPAAAMLKLGLASAAMMGGFFGDDRNWAQEALAIAHDIGDKSLLAACLGMRATSSRLAGTITSESLAHVQEAAALVDALPDGELGRHLEACVWLGWGEQFVERLDDAIRHLDRGLRVARETGQNHMVAYLLVGRGTVYGLTGPLAQAVECFDDALEAGYLMGSDELRAMALTEKCWMSAWRGDVELALEIGQEAVSAAGPVRDWFSAMARAMHAQAKLYSGDATGCVELLTAECGGADLSMLDPMSRAGWFSLLTEAEIDRGRVEQAQDWAARAVAVTAGSPLALHQGFAQLAQGLAALPVDPAQSAKWACEAATSFARAGDRVDEGRACLLAANAYSAMGDQNSARTSFAQARAHFEASGAGLFLRHAIRDERRMNTRRQRGRTKVDGGGLAALTRREREVAVHVAQGLTNRQVAERLYLSPRTVEVHLSRAFAKLGVSTRAALARAVAADSD